MVVLGLGLAGGALVASPSGVGFGCGGAAPAVRASNQAGVGFSAAKRRAADIYADHRETFYCGCAYDAELRVEPAACGYVPANPDSRRAQRVEWEHVVPAHAFGHGFAAWRDGHPACVNGAGKAYRGRRCARKQEPDFVAMEADLHNLVPAIGELNGRRSHYGVAMLPGEPRRFGACDFEVEDRKVEPRPAVRGDVARTYLYMDAAYPARGVVSAKNAPLLQAWSREDPVDGWECERERRIARQQGNPNPIVRALCLEAGL